jgi:hypothetical protein
MPKFVFFICLFLQDTNDPSKLIISQLRNIENMISGIGSVENRPTLISNVVDKGLPGATFNLQGNPNGAGNTVPLVPLYQPSPGNPLNPGSTFFTTTGVRGVVVGVWAGGV